MNYYLTVSLLIVCLVLNSCKTTPIDGNNTNPEPSFEPGFGRSKERPVGTPFEWPKGITLIGRPRTDYDCLEEAGREHEYGNGGAVILCLNFYNRTDQPITIQLPPGLIFISKSKDIQNGILVSTVSIEVPAKERYLALLYLYCINLDRGVSAPDVSYEEQPIVSRHPGMEELYRLLATKKANFEDYPMRRNDPNAQHVAEIVVGVINDISYGKPIKEEKRRQIAALPDR